MSIYSFQNGQMKEMDMHEQSLFRSDLNALINKI